MSPHEPFTGQRGGTLHRARLSRRQTLTTPRLSPLKTEAMYAPETFGRSAGDRVIVVPNDRK
ncbi:hypothetical protein KKF84_03040 [Myxococcota bacterium]|nr:hypothetical protein [Myxococcota bacterium]MBU1534265.1 hypothetical protein [Myxococcota bacterium]